MVEKLGKHARVTPSDPDASVFTDTSSEDAAGSAFGSDDFDAYRFDGYGEANDSFADPADPANAKQNKQAKKAKKDKTSGKPKKEKKSRKNKKGAKDKNEAIFVLLRHKIIAAIMLVLAMLFAGIMTVIYTSTYFEVYQEDISMLENYTRSELKTYSQPQTSSNPATQPFTSIESEFGDDLSSPRYRLSTFYSVILSSDGEVLRVNNNSSNIYSNLELSQMAQAMVKRGDQDGTFGETVYLITYFAASGISGTIVSMMDNTVFQEMSNTLLRYALIFGSICLVGFFFLAHYLARWMVQPLENSYMHQIRFISDAGHELKTPIAVINANSELLERQIGQNQWLENIRYENSRMGDLVAKLLQLAHAEQDTPDFETLDFSRLVAGEVLPFESIAFERGLSLETDIQPDLFVAGNKMQLQQLTSILLDNALSYATENSTISLAVRSERTNAVLSVGNFSDNISEETGDHMFDRFYRVDNARTGDGGHYGLGLSIAKAVTKTHKGTIEAKVEESYITVRFSVPLA